jgi:RNA polymerase sigma-70 factor (ECF subfamily)
VKLFESRARADFDQIIEKHMDVLLHSALRLTRHHEEAEDVVQDTYLRAWKYFHRFEPGTNARAWLFRIMFNVINQRYSDRQPGHANESVSIEDSGLDQILASAPPPAFSTWEVMDALEKLPVDYRSVMLMVVVEEFSYKETAEILNIPLGTVMSRLHRGRQALRVMLLPRSSAMPGRN